MVCSREINSTLHHIPGWEKYSVGLNSADRFLLRYNLPMNKRAKKRLVEAIKKDKLERANPAQKSKPNFPQDDPKQKAGFLPRPDKKRG